MKGKYKFKRMFKLLNSLIILCALTLSYSYVWLNYYNISVNPTVDENVIFNRTGNYLIIVLYFIIVLLFTLVFGALKIGYLKVSNLIYSLFLSIVITNFITYFQMSLVARMLVQTIPLLTLTVLQIAFVCIWSVIFNKLYFYIFPPHNMVIVYGSKLATQLVYKMSTRYDKYRISYSISIDKGIEAIKEIIPSFEGVIICDVPSTIRNDVLKFCYENSIRTYVTPKISDIIIRGGVNIDLFDTPIILCRNTGLDFGQRLIKRTFDLILSIIALIVFSPAMLIISAAIKLYDKGPVFYKQERVTINNKVFSILKFRSMIVDAEKDGKSIPATNGDPRITPVGKIIRALRFDELPQIFNILTGDMSIVGPRPERIEHIEEYSKEIPEFRFRLKVKGGLTGYAQVYGKYNTTAYDKLRLDLMYIQNYSFVLDLKLIVSTFKILFMRESTEGFSLKPSADEIKGNKQ